MKMYVSYTYAFAWDEKGANRSPFPNRLMSDYEVNLVNDSMQEFCVRFYGPAESASILPSKPSLGLLSLMCN